MNDEPELTTRLATLEAHVRQQDRRIQTLEGRRPGRKALPIVVSELHVCGVDPEIDSAACPHASLYRRQKGCKGDRCVQISQDYYEARRKKT
jgi:hypothetical protein